MTAQKKNENIKTKERSINRTNDHHRSGSKKQQVIVDQDSLNSENPVDKSKKQPDARVDMGDIIRGFASSGSRIVQQAANILEEEIAAGIIAAKKVEQTIINVNKSRSQDPNDLIQRFRRDSHEIVDIMLDLVDTTIKNGGTFAKQLVKVIPGMENKKNDAGGGLTVLEMPEPISRGSSASIAMTFENGDEKTTGEFDILNTDLLSSAGVIIPADYIQFSPSRLSIRAKSKREISITVDVPPDIPIGIYTGLIQATRIEHLKAVLVVNVI